MSTYHVENFGCRATQADGAAIDRQFEQRGLARAAAVEADIVVLNTCTVTASADRDARSAIRRVRRQNPDAKIVVTGCYAQRAPQEIANLAGVACVVGNSHKHQLAELALLSSFSTSTRGAVDDKAIADKPVPTDPFVPLAALLDNHAGGLEPEAGSRLFVSDIFAHTDFLAAPTFEMPGVSHGDRRTRPNLKVQDGCDNRCSFCVIPYVRGRSRSLPLAQLLHEVNALVAAGYREVVISGINLGRWGRDLAVSHQPSAISDPATKSGARGLSGSYVGRGQRRPTNNQRPDFESLIRAILDQTSLERLRISSVEPMDWSNELIRLMAGSPRIARHAHVPLQSGSDAVLRRMHRKYRPWHYREKIEKIHAAMPAAAIGADVMVGFPGETDAEFEATRRFIENLPFTYLHVFTYSARPGTPAAIMPDQVPVHIARERNRVLRALADEKKWSFMRSFIGRQVEAITLGLSDASSAFTEALTDNYLKLRLNGFHSPNQWVKVEVNGVATDALVGQAIVEDSCLATSAST